MPLNDDLILGSLTDPKSFPGDGQEDLNLELLMYHDQKLLLRYISKHVGKYTLADVVNMLRECDDTYWQKVLSMIINVYHLENLQMYLTDTPMTNFSSHVRQLIIDLKITLLEQILEGVIKKDMSREDFENAITNVQSVLLKWSIKFITREDYVNFLKVLFEEYRKPIYSEGDEN